jgi:hypothetical protein
MSTRPNGSGSVVRDVEDGTKFEAEFLDWSQTSPTVNCRLGTRLVFDCEKAP